MKINWKVRLKNPVFWIQIIVSIGMTAFAYSATEVKDLNSWRALLELIKGLINNPYLIGLCLWNAWSAINDPTTVGVSDSATVLVGTKHEANKEAE